MADTTNTVERTILRGNSAGTGFLTAEDPGKWFNLSRYASPSPVIPPAGTTARLTVDAKGFVRRIEATNRTSGVSESRPDTPEPALSVEARIALIQAAATFLAPRSASTSGDVISAAQVWASWLEGAYQPAERE